MPTGQERLEEISNGEAESLQDESRELLLKLSSSAGLSPRLDDSVKIIGRNTSADDVVRYALQRMEKYKVVLLVAKSKEISRLVSAVEQVKLKRRVKQLNQASVQPSLINPAYNPKQSITNIQTFFGDEIESTKSQEAAAKREIHGHKVYEVPCLRVALFAHTVELEQLKLAGWTVQ